LYFFSSLKHAKSKFFIQKVFVLFFAKKVNKFSVFVSIFERKKVKNSDDKYLSQNIYV